MLNSLSSLPRLYRTVRHLKPGQIFHRIRFKLPPPAPDTTPPPPLRDAGGQWMTPAARQPSMIGAKRLFLLGEEGDLDQTGWYAKERSYLWQYNLHYFDDLNAKDSLERRAWHETLIDDWIASNAPGEGVGWEPYPTSLRMVNWIKWSLSRRHLDVKAQHSLAIQARCLRDRLEYHLLGNHLFANAKALVFAGLYFSSDEADEWLSKGLAILENETPEQILPDGGQFELSPMYHALALEDLLDLANLARRYHRRDLFSIVAAPIPKMLRWLQVMAHPDGEIAFFNDAAIGVAPSPAELFAFAGRLDLAAESALPAPVHLASSGYARLEDGQAVVLADIARVGPDYLPGHAHADTLSFELSLGRKRAVVNSGTSVYGTGPERRRQRGTSAHSTVVVSNTDSSEVWSGFRVGRRARPFDIRCEKLPSGQFVAASHDGYRHLRGAPIHRRQWVLNENSLRIDDWIDGNGVHDIEAIFHLAPWLNAELINRRSAHVSSEDGSTAFEFRTSAGACEIMPSTWHPGFGMSAPSKAIKIALHGSLPARLETTFIWSTA